MSELYANEQSLEMLDAMEIGIVFCASDYSQEQETLADSTQLIDQE
ncbi:hypothetical protein [Vibrio maerlii]|nr:hypothetical protein [Vibrio maerlii]